MCKLYNLIEVRKDYHLTQKEVAKYLNLSKSTYSEIENDSNKLRLEYLYKLAYLFNTNPEYLSELVRTKEVLDPKLKKAIEVKYKLNKHELIKIK